MRILHLISSEASRRDREQQRIDALHLRDVELTAIDLSGNDGTAPLQREPVDLIHVYGAPPFPLLRGVRTHWIGAAEPPPSRLPWRRMRQPAVPPSELLAVPESVDPAWLQDPPPERRTGPIASLYGESRSAIRRDVLVRLARVRGDVDWIELRRPPAPGDLARFALWVDVAADEDGGALEALASGLLTVAARTPRNMQRSAGGAAAILVPTGDANEIAHAILKALFKPETVEGTLEATRAQRSRFDPRLRAESLTQLYRRIT